MVIFGLDILLLIFGKSGWGLYQMNKIANIFEKLYLEEVRKNLNLKREIDLLKNEKEHLKDWNKELEKQNDFLNLYLHASLAKRNSR